VSLWDIPMAGGGPWGAGSGGTPTWGWLKKKRRRKTRDYFLEKLPKKSKNYFHMSFSSDPLGKITCSTVLLPGSESVWMESCVNSA